MILIISICLLVPAVLCADSTISIENAEQYWFYYVIDPPYLTYYDYSDPDFAHYVLKYFTRPVEDTDFTTLTPGQVHSYSNLSAGNHIVVGFFVPGSRLVYPVKIINMTVQQGQGERRYIVYNTASNISVTTGVGILKNFIPETEPTTGGVILDIKLDNSYKDWTQIPITASFSSTYNPVYFNQEIDGNVKTLPIENSLYWKRGGTQVKDLKVLMDNFYLYFYTRTHTAIQEGLLLYLYLHENREQIQDNHYTIEVNPDLTSDNGKVYLWEKGVTSPREIGSCVNTGNYLEGRLELVLLPEEVKYGLLNRYSFDFTTCFFDTEAALYEEFFYTTVYFRDIPNILDLY